MFLSKRKRNDKYQSGLNRWKKKRRVNNFQNTYKKNQRNIDNNFDKMRILQMKRQYDTNNDNDEERKYYYEDKADTSDFVTKSSQKKILESVLKSNKKPEFRPRRNFRDNNKDNFRPKRNFRDNNRDNFKPKRNFRDNNRDNFKPKRNFRDNNRDNFKPKRNFRDNNRDNFRSKRKFNNNDRFKNENKFGDNENEYKKKKFVKKDDKFNNKFGNEFKKKKFVKKSDTIFKEFTKKRFDKKFDKNDDNNNVTVFKKKRFEKKFDKNENKNSNNVTTFKRKKRFRKKRRNELKHFPTKESDTIKNELIIESIPPKKKKKKIETKEKCYYGFYVDYVILENGRKYPGKVSIINSDQVIICNTTIKPIQKIVNYRSNITGLSEENFQKNNQVNLPELKTSIIKYFNSQKTQCVLVGHIIYKCFNWIRMKPKKHNILYKDVAFFEHTLMNDKKQKPKVRSLEYLNQLIFKQKNTSVLSTLEKATKSLEIFNLNKKNFEKLRINVMKKKFFK